MACTLGQGSPNNLHPLHTVVPLTREFKVQKQHHVTRKTGLAYTNSQLILQAK
jgi:hypothetical protein